MMHRCLSSLVSPLEMLKFDTSICFEVIADSYKCTALCPVA
jgi:hypothetical protein